MPPYSDSLTVTVNAKDDHCIVRLVGSAGADHIDDLDGRLREVCGTTSKLILDLSELTFINSAGLGAIIAAHRRCRDRGGLLCIAGAREGVAQVLRITHLDRLIGTYPDCEAAQKSLGFTTT
jgi:anti-anti-sigma factor